MTDTGLVHVVYAPYGLEPLSQFLDSYRRHSAGIEHDLILAFKAFPDASLPEEYRTALAGLPHQALFVPDGGYDLGSYFLAARACEHRFLCFLNSRSVILADRWLGKLRAAFDEPGVGLVGATANRESVTTNQWLLPCPPENGSRRRRFANGLRRRGRFLLALRNFPPFPNLHLRTNAFMIERLRLLASPTRTFRCKEDCYRFESGRRSLTRQVLARRLQARVVGRDGRSYPPESWHESETFRSGDQRNLLVADNQTREYLAAGLDERRRLTAAAWGA